MALSRAQAAEALARVESDAEARAAFLAAYTGDEDGVAALREAADPAERSTASAARDARLKEWQRVAYGRTETAEEEDAAARAADEIAWEESHRASIAAALEAAVTALAGASEPAEATPSELEAKEPADANSPAPQRRRLTVPVVAVIAVVAIAIGAAVTFGSLASKSRPGSIASPNAAPHSPKRESSIGSSITRTYTASQVDAWFTATAESADTFPQPSYLATIGLRDGKTRFVTTQSTGWSLWVAKSHTGQTCLLVNGTVQRPTTSQSNCLPSRAIEQGRAVVINSHGMFATLTRNDLVVAILQG